MQQMGHLMVFDLTHRSQVILERQGIGTAHQHRRRRIDVAVVIEPQGITHQKRKRKVSIVEQRTLGPAVCAVYQRRKTHLVVVGEHKIPVVG